MFEFAKISDGTKWKILKKSWVPSEIYWRNLKEILVNFIGVCESNVDLFWYGFEKNYVKILRNFTKIL